MEDARNSDLLKLLTKVYFFGVEFYYQSNSYSIEHGTDYKKISLRLCVCLSVCEHSHGRIC